jgi:hypothetical protein
MKKLLLVTAICVAGFMSAKTINSERNDSKSLYLVNQKQKNLEKLKLLYHWIEIVSPCGVIYYLPAENYTGCTWDDFYGDVAYFNDQKCGDTVSQFT